MKKINTFLLIILLTGVIISCKQKSSDPKNSHISIEHTIITDTVVVVDTLFLESFTEFPPQINGCACYFSSSEINFKNKKYIYADDFAKFAFISLNGKMIKLNLIEDKISDTTTYKTFKNEDYEIIIDVKQISELDETWQMKGTLTVKLKSGQVIIKNIYGECGC